MKVGGEHLNVNEDLYPLYSMNTEIPASQMCPHDFTRCFAVLLSVSADKPCAPREFGAGNIVCVCNMTYCDTISKVVPVPVDQFIQYSTSRSGLRFHKTLGSFSDSPHAGGKRLKSRARWLVW
jgi:hypothetical protein